MYFSSDAHHSNYETLLELNSDKQEFDDYMAALYILALPEIFPYVQPEKSLFDWFYDFSDLSPSPETKPLLPYVEKELSPQFIWLVHFAYSLWSQHPIRFNEGFLQLSPTLLRCVAEAMRIVKGIYDTGEAESH